MAKARHESRLHSRAFEARFGWLCARYTAQCYWWDLMYIETRFATLLVGGLVKNKSTAAFSILGIATGTLALQLIFKPFQETQEEKGKWTSTNNVGVLSYACQVIVLLCGLTSLYRDPEPELDADAVDDDYIAGFIAGHKAGRAQGYDAGLLDGVLCMVAILAMCTPVVVTVFILWTLFGAASRHEKGDTASTMVAIDQTTFVNPIDQGSDGEEEYEFDSMRASPKGHGGNRRDRESHRGKDC